MDEAGFRAWTLLPLAAVIAPAFAADYLTPEQAAAIFYPQADRQIPLLLKLSKEQRRQIRSLAGVRQREQTQQVWRAETDGKLLGWTIVDDVIGKHEYITYAAAISADGQVLGIEILSYRETHGGEVRRASWRENFAGMTLQDPFKLDVDIPNISGATLSCRNVTDGVKRLLALQRIALSP